MRILFLTQLFQPESFFKGLPFAKELKDKGHEVEVLTGFPNYPGGKVYPGYRIRFYQQEIMDGIKVHRVPLYPSHDKCALRRIINYLTLSLSVFLMGPWLVKKPDIIYVYNLVTLGMPAFLLRFIYGSRVIMDIQDLWPESVASSGMLGNKKIINVMYKICNWIYKSSDGLVVLSPGFKNHLINRGVPPENIEVIYNWCDENAKLKQSFKIKSAELDGKFVILYAGAMGGVQGLDTLLKCAAICGESMPDVQFLMIGDGADRQRLEELAVKMKLNNITFLPRRPIEEMGEIYAMAAVLIVHLQDDPLFRITIPSKTQAYLYSGKPIIMAVRGDAAELVRQAGAGVICEPGNPQAMAAAVKKLYDAGVNERVNMGEAGYQFYMQNLSFAQGVNNFERVMSDLLQ